MSRPDSCPNCGSWSKDNKPCKVTTCEACGSPQCMKPGGGNCVVCLIGHLQGFNKWCGAGVSRRLCQYTGCKYEYTIDRAPRKKAICNEHAKTATKEVRIYNIAGPYTGKKEKITVWEYIQRLVQERARKFALELPIMKYIYEQPDEGFVYDEWVMGGAATAWSPQMALETVLKDGGSPHPTRPPVVVQYPQPHWVVAIMAGHPVD